MKLIGQSIEAHELILRVMERICVIGGRDPEFAAALMASLTSRGATA